MRYHHEQKADITYTHGGVTLTDTATVGVNVKTLHVDVAVMTTNNVACVQKSRVDADMKAMQERYAQANIKVEWTYKTFPAPPSVMAHIANGTDWGVDKPQDNITPLRVLTPEGRAVIDATGLSADNFRVIYMPRPLHIGTKVPGAFGDEVRGYALTSDVFTHNDDKDYAGNTCFVTEGGTTHFIPAHEVVHLLRNDGKHEDFKWNLMYKSVPLIPFDPAWNDLRANKRLTQGFIDAIRQNGKLQ